MAIDKSIQAESSSPLKKKEHHRRVLRQEGRVQIDADWNEQTEVDKHSSGTRSNLTGRKVRIRPAEPSDYDELYTWWNDRDFSGEYGGYFPMSRPEFESLLKDSWWFVIETLGEQKKVGFISYFSPRWDYRNLFEIGYRINPSERNKGYTTEAVRLLVDHLFTTRKEIVRLEALTDVENLPSQRVLENNGFRREGVLKKRFFTEGQYRDDCIYAILRDEWQKGS
jgi:RimJ/RimL family protein N-acetyltransferase